MIEISPMLISAFVLGLLGAGHCMGMCGGIAAALSFAVSDKSRSFKLILLSSYNIGRVSSYAVLGGITVLASSLLPSSGLPLARTLSGLLMLAVGLYLANGWKGIAWLERGGYVLWRYIKPLGDKVMPVDGVGKALALGAVWGWLPCGLVYSALAYASVQTTFLQGALIMLAFGLGTAPAIFMGGVAATRVKQWFTKRNVRIFLAYAYMAFGLWTIGAAWYHQLLHSNHDLHSRAESHNHQHSHH